MAKNTGTQPQDSSPESQPEMHACNPSDISPPQPQDNPSDLLEGPEFFVITESPIGTFGILSALAVAFGIFVIVKKS